MYNDTVIIPGRYNVVKFDQNNNIIQVISLADPHWLQVYGPEELEEEETWARMVWDGQDDDDYPEEDDPNQIFRWNIVDPQGQTILQGGLKTWNQEGDCIWLD